MNILFVHNNFPAQYRYLVRRHLVRVEPGVRDELVQARQAISVDLPFAAEQLGRVQAVGLHDDRRIKLQHAVNQGKGAAVRTAAAAATGDYVQPFDADMEYQPEEIPELLKPVLRGEATVVFGSRTFGSHSAYSFWYVMGNKGVTTVANILFNAYIADLETCYKLMPLELYRSLDITSNGFGMEAEITGKLLARQIRPFEVPITYRARSREEGKKITWKDGVAAVWLLTRIRVTSKRAQRRGSPA